MRILVTGAAGFIGYHLCARLLDEGHEVVGLDDLSSGSRANIDDLRSRDGFEFIEHDLVRPLPERLDPPDRIYNLACPASPRDFDRRNLEILAVCSQGVWNVLELARRCGARVLHASTSEVYGDPLEHPQRESYRGNVNPVGPRACYDEGKRFAEALCAHYARRHGIAVRLARIFNTYGPRMRANDGRALPNFITQALRDEPLTVHGDGSQTRSFCYVDDLVAGLIRLCESDVEGPVNLGNPDEVSILQVAREIIELTQSRSTITHRPAPPDDPRVRCPDITRAREHLRWEPTVSRREGLRRTIEWFRRQQTYAGS